MVIITMLFYSLAQIRLWNLIQLDIFHFSTAELSRRNRKLLSILCKSRYCVLMEAKVPSVRWSNNRIGVRTQENMFHIGVYERK